MAGNKETPRQRMIGMMYLVLTALLALNVSKEIVNAFVRLNDKMEDSNRILQSKIDQDYDHFSSAMAVKHTRAAAEKWNEKAMEIKQVVDKEYQYLFGETNDLLKETEGSSSNWLQKDPRTGKTQLKQLMAVEAKDDYDAATRIFVGGNPMEPNQRGQQLRNNLQKLRDKICNVLGTYDEGGKSYSFNAASIKNYDPRDTKTHSALRKALETANPSDTSVIARVYRTLSYPATLTEYDETTSWQGAMFDHAPVVAAAAILTSLRTDVKTAEALALELLITKIKSTIFYINKIEPVAFAPKGYLNVGDTMPLRVMIAAYDSNDVSKVRYAENPELKDSREITGPISIKASTPGVKTVYGNIAVKERGELVWKPWSFTYEVGQPSASISPTDLNILYAGYANNVSATASGYSSQDITLTGSGVTITKSSQGYIVKPPLNMVGSTVKLSVMAKGKQVGSMDFRIRKTPKPLTFFGNIPNTETYITRAQLAQAVNAGVGLRPDENAPIRNMVYKVNSFNVEFSVNGAEGKFSCPTGKFTQADINKLMVLRPGANITIRNIVGTGPSGSSERATPISLTIR